MLFDQETFKRGGRTFIFREEHDTDMGPPWKEDDGNGIVSEWRNSREKEPGERVLCHDRGSYRYYDFKRTLEQAKRDGWGIGAEALEELTRRLGRTPTKKEIVVEAVERDFKYIQGWCNDEWHWVWIGVELLDENGHKAGEMESLGGISSEDSKYIEVEAYRMADGINERMDEEEKEKEYWAARDTATV